MKAAERRSIRFSYPIEKFERQEDGSMVVYGLLSSEAVATDGAIMPQEVLVEAFSRLAKIPLREMHQPIAAGYGLDLLPEEGGRTYLRSRISAGARDTQAKVEDGTLSAYSIGGMVGGYRVDKDSGAKRITDFIAREASLVDVGADPETNTDGLRIVRVEAEEPGGAVEVVVGSLTAEDVAAAEAVAEVERAAVAEPEPAQEQEEAAPAAVSDDQGALQGEPTERAEQAEEEDAMAGGKIRDMAKRMRETFREWDRFLAEFAPDEEEGGEDVQAEPEAEAEAEPKDEDTEERVDRAEAVEPVAEAQAEIEPVTNPGPEQAEEPAPAAGEPAERAEGTTENVAGLGARLEALERRNVELEAQLLALAKSPAPAGPARNAEALERANGKPGDIFQAFERVKRANPHLGPAALRDLVLEAMSLGR